MAEKSFVFPKRIETIQVLRAAAAFCLSLYHFKIISSMAFIPKSPFTMSRSFLILIFYAISGFLFMLSTTEAPSGNKKPFVIRRMVRMLPLYYLLTIVTFTAAQIMPEIIGYKPTVSELVKSFLFIPFMRGSLKSGATLRPIVGPAHTLYMEMAFTAVFAIAIKINRKHRGDISFICSVLIWLIGVTVGFKNDIAKFYISENAYSWLAFAAGIFVFALFERMEKNKLCFGGAKAGILAAVTAMFAVLTQLTFGHVSQKATMIFVTAVCALLVALAVGSSFVGVRPPKLIVKFGDMSYSYYLLHYYIVSVAERFLGMEALSLRNVLLIVPILALAWAVAYVSYIIIEKKFSSFLLNINIGKVKTHQS